MQKTFDKNSVLERRGKNVNPADEESSKAAASFCRLFELIRILRAPDGCPWDREQTPMSMRRDLVEEVFEAVDAIGEKSATHAKEELGDVLLNSIMISYMYSQGGEFYVDEMFDELVEKLIRRHPHVFEQSEGKVCAENVAKTSGEVLTQWDRIKENVEGRARDSILDEVPQGFPPLLRAIKMQKKAAKKGFDWTSLAPTREKILEELSEVDDAIRAKENSLAENIISEIQYSDSDLDRYAVLRLLFSLIPNKMDFAKRYALSELERNNDVTRFTAMQLLNEIEFIDAD